MQIGKSSKIKENRRHRFKSHAPCAHIGSTNHGFDLCGCGVMIIESIPQKDCCVHQLPILMRAPVSELDRICVYVCVVGLFYTLCLLKFGSLAGILYRVVHDTSI